MAGVISLSVALTRTLAVGEANRKAFLASEHSTTTMKGYIVGSAAALVISAAIVIIVMGVPEEAEGSINYTEGSWTVNETTTLSDGTWQVNGSVTVEGCMLTLQNATLILGNGMYHQKITVSDDGRLVARWSTLVGQPSSRAYGYLNGDVELSNTTVKWFYCLAQQYGQLVVDNCTFEAASTHIESYANLTVRSSKFHDANYAFIAWQTNYNLPTSFISVEGSTFIDDIGEADYGVNVRGDYYNTPDNIGIVKGCQFVSLSCAVHVSNFYRGSMQVVGNRGLNCIQGLQIDRMSPATSIHDNSWTLRSGYNGIGVYLYDSVYLHKALIWNETVTGGYYGIYISNFDITLVLKGVTVTDSTIGVYVLYGGGKVEVRNSTVMGSQYDFYVYDYGSISVFNTTHNYKSFVYPDYYNNYRGSIEESCTVAIGVVMWQSGRAITTGWTNIVNETGTVLTSFRNEMPGTVEIPFWRVVWDGTVFASSIRGAFKDRGVPFYSRPIPIKGVESMSFTIIDDSLPWARVASPMHGDVFKTQFFKVEGVCDDLGSGLSTVQIKWGDENWRDTQFDTAGVWSVVIAGISDDTADVVVRVRDVAGNINETVLEDITVDTMMPTITVLSPKAPVNRSPTTLMAMTEPHARAFVNSIEVPVADNGAMVASVELLEGLNKVMVSVVDMAGNEASAEVMLTLDTIPPTLRLDSPSEGAWFRTEFVKVIGLVSEGVTITASGETFYADEGMFESTVTLKEELTLVVVTAVDGAGNVASESRLVHLDTAKPRLSVTYPLSGSYLTTPHALVRGMVRDEGPVGVTVGAWTAEVSGEQWSCEVGLVEGRNSINVVARDAAGNVDSTYLDLNLDTAPPQAVVRLQVNGQSVDPTLSTVNTRATSLSLEVSLDEDCAVDMNVDGPSSLPAGMSNLTIKLQEGLNDVRIELRDLAGNRGAPVRFQVLVDTVRPVLELERAGQVRTRDPDLVVSGSTEPGCQVMVDGVAVGLLNDNTFSTVVHLNEGSNLIEITSVDAAGNSAYKNLVVDLETVKVGTSPFEGTAGGIAIGLVIGILVALGAFGWRTRRRPAAHAAAEEPSVAPTDDTPSGRTEGEREVAEPRARVDVVYPRAGVVRRRGR